VTALGFKIKKAFQTGVELNGTLADCIRLNLSLCSASQVLYSLKAFTCNSPQQLYDTVAQVQWETIIAKDGYFSVTSTVEHPTINTPLFANVKVKDAIVDRFREKTGERPNSGPNLESTVVHLFWRMTLRRSSRHLRRNAGKAWLQKNSGSRSYDGITGNGRCLPPDGTADPHSSTRCVAHQQSLLKQPCWRLTGNRLIQNNYGFMHILGYDESIFEDAKTKLKEQIIELPSLKVIATDISQDAVNISKINAEPRA